jgi:hypothetical protein
MPTVVQEVHEAAKVKCPKKEEATKEAWKDIPCTGCENYRKCMGAIFGALGL